ncbi:hypothetical protein EJ04DRAFT_579094 [Polyplosphaeria fusca]|uniref:Integral membrane protein n=1 Tax=Polyplosphaeria fusca TaxID=682080 RepID=A0A9P4UWW2_9PLEO|nr:hypothetical protein EJ04DRAFT_579094 [Polyplosphaeria fusca]
MNLDEVLENASRVQRFDLLTSTGLVFCVTLVALAITSTFKLSRQHPFSFPDYFVFFGIVCLIGATGMFYASLGNFYIGAVLTRDPLLVVKNVPEQSRKLDTLDLNAALVAIPALLWTATFSAKAALLVVFRPKKSASEGMKGYWFGTIGVTGVAWMYIAAVPFIGCHDFGMGSYKCLSPNLDDISPVLGCLGIAMDIVTDLMIIATIIIILRNKQPTRYQNIAIALIALLTICLITISIFRVTPIPGTVAVLEDSIWQTFWIYIETCATLSIILITLLWCSHSEHDGQQRIISPRASRRASVRSSVGSIKKEDISTPVFMGGTSEWVASSVWERYLSGVVGQRGSAKVQSFFSN